MPEGFFTRIPRHAAALTPAVLVLAATAANAHAGDTVPWLDRPVAAPAPSQAQAVPSLHPCAQQDLAITAGPTGAYRGYATQEIQLTNHSQEACYLTGVPDLQLVPASGVPQTVGTAAIVPQAVAQRIDMLPGEQASILVGTPGSCDAAVGQERHVSHRMKVAPAGGGVLLLDGVHVDTLCGAASVLRFHRIADDSNQPSLASAPALGALSVSMTAPGSAARGSTLHYTVTIVNPGARTIPLAPCPAYTQSLYIDGKALSRAFQLNCSAVANALPPNSTTRFDMEVAIPADLPSGTAKLGWTLQNGLTAGALVNLQ